MIYNEWMNKLLFLTIYDWLLNLLKERGNYKQEDARLIRVMEVANNANAVMLFFSAMSLPSYCA